MLQAQSDSDPARSLYFITQINVTIEPSIFFCVHKNNNTLKSRNIKVVSTILQAYYTMPGAFWYFLFNPV